MQAANSITPTRKGFINSLAETSYKTVTNYDVKLQKGGKLTLPTMVQGRRERETRVLRVYRMGATSLIPNHARNPKARAEMPPHLRY